jgi:hypothetical protein
MERKSLLLFGTALIIVGILSLTLSGIAALVGFDPARFLLRFWPVVVSCVGLCFLIPPLLVRGRRGLGALFIPGMPILTTGGLLLLASVFNAWRIWNWLWPMELISVAVGFALAAIYMRSIWLLIPATIIGLNGLVFQFCAISGLWHWWSVLWVIEPLSVGLALLGIGLRRNLPGLRTAGVILCTISAGLLVMMLLILGVWWPLGVLGPGLLLLAGAVLLAWSLLRSTLTPSSALE